MRRINEKDMTKCFQDVMQKRKLVKLMKRRNKKFFEGKKELQSVQFL